MENEKHTLTEAVAGIIDNTQEITHHTPSPDERRQYRRRAARWLAKITTRNKEVVHCRTRDVSERGASISSPYDFNLNAVIVLEIQVSYKETRKTLRVLGEVRHRAITKDSFILGILFRDASDGTTAFLQQYANKLI